MPYDGQGNYSLPQGSIVEVGDTVLPSQHNPPLQDIASVLSAVMVRDGRAPMVAPLAMNNNPITGLAAGTDPTDAATVAQVTGASPIGVVVDFAGDTAPNGWMLCYGQAVSRTTFAAAFAVIGTKYGAGDGATTFNLPDCRGRVTAGRDDMGGADAKRLSDFFGAVARTLGGVLGAASHVLTLAQLPAHTHPAGSLTTTAAGEHTHTSYLGSSRDNGDPGPYVGTAPSEPNGSNGSTSAAGNHVHGVTGSTGSNGSGQAHGIAQPSIVFNKIIRVSI